MWGPEGLIFALGLPDSLYLVSLVVSTLWLYRQTMDPTVLDQGPCSYFLLLLLLFFSVFNFSSLVLLRGCGGHVDRLKCVSSLPVSL